MGRNLNISSSTCEEAFHLDIYHKAIAPWLSTYSQPAFFHSALPLWSSQSQAIKHGLVAVAMAGEEYYLGKHVKQHRRIWHYDQALKHMYVPNASPDVVMLACIVLWLHDNIVEDTFAAVMHVKGFVRMLLAYEKRRSPANVSKNLDCTIWRGLSHWGQRTQPYVDTRLGLGAVTTVRQKLQDPRLGRLSQDSNSCSADVLLFITSIAWACDKPPAAGETAPPITFQELRSFLDSWYITTLSDLEPHTDDCKILRCHYNIMNLSIRAQEQSAGDHNLSWNSDTEALNIFEEMLDLLESISIDSRIQKPGKKDLVLPIVPVALEAERMAPSLHHKLRIEAFLRSIRRVESFWSTSVIARVIEASVTN